jgi:hypothetical protein
MYDDEILHEHLSPMEQISLLELNRKLKYTTTSSTNPSSNQKSLLDELSSLIEIETTEATDFDFSLDRLDRINRYDAIRRVISEHNILQKALTAYSTNIFLKHSLAVDKDTISINTNHHVYTDVKTVVKGLFKYFSIEKNLKEKVLFPLLVTGDAFVEVIDLSTVGFKKETKTETVDVVHEDGTKSSLIFEVPETNNSISQRVESLLNVGIDGVNSIKTRLENATSVQETFNILLEEKGLDFIDEEDGIENVLDEQDIKSRIDYSKLTNVYLEHHAPDNVVIIEHYDQILGYVVIDNVGLAGNGETGTTRRSGLKNQVTLEFLKTKVEEIVSSFASNKKNFPKELVEEVTNNKNLKIALYKHLLTNRNTRIRIVSPEKIVRFNLDINKYAPYGTSVFDNSVIPANNELLSNSATLIGKIARTPILRNWHMEIGSRKSEEKYVQKFTDNISNRNITYDDVFKVKTKPRTIKAFDDVVTITKGGKRYLDLEQIEYPRMPDTTAIDESLKNATIESLNIPRSFLGVDGNDQLREEIVASNINFAKEISSIQNVIEHGIYNLLNKVFVMINDLGKVSNIEKFVTITLNHPIILKLQAYEQIMSSVSNVQRTLSDSGVNVDPLLFYKQEMPFIKWDNMLEESIISKVKQKLLGVNLPPEDGTDGMGGMGGMGGNPENEEQPADETQENNLFIHQQFTTFTQLVKLRSTLIQDKRFADSVLVLKLISEIPDLSSEELMSRTNEVLEFLDKNKSEDIDE